jgi:hypothetical protein
MAILCCAERGPVVRPQHEERPCAGHDSIASSIWDGTA